jgi:hypothetical protein
MNDVVDKWADLYNAPEHAEREQLKARVIELAKENVKLRDAVAKAALDVEYWRRRATRNAP